MNIRYVDLRKNVLAYKIIDNVIYANDNGKVYKADFTNLPDGLLVGCDASFIGISIEPENGTYKKDGILNITLRKPVDQDGNEIPQEDFSTDEYEKVKIKWKTQEEIEEEKLLESLIPTEKEIEDAELEIKTITLLQDLEVI
jgi:hypothetical protein